jgi:hypothetical protein
VLVPPIEPDTSVLFGGCLDVLEEQFAFVGRVCRNDQSTTRKGHVCNPFHRSLSVCVECAHALSAAFAPVGLVRFRVGAVVPRVRAWNV